MSLLESVSTLDGVVREDCVCDTEGSLESVDSQVCEDNDEGLENTEFEDGGLEFNELLGVGVGELDGVPEGVTLWVGVLLDVLL